MDNEPQKNNFKDRVLAEIEHEHVQAYSKTRFIWRLILLFFVGALFLAISVFIFGFVFFFIRVSGRTTLLDAGSPGFWFFIESFPWLWLAVDIVLLVAL